MLRPARPPRRQRGLSLVELMVGIAVGLIVTAAATLLVSGQLAENRRLIAEAQLQQDLRASLDIIVRELRRAGLHPLPASLVWNPAGSAEPPMNPYTQNVTVTSLAPDASQVEFAYAGGTGVSVPDLGFRLNTTTQALESKLRGAGWQEMTDSNAIEVTLFRVEEVLSGETQVTCRSACSDGTNDCWPLVRSRSLSIELGARSKLDPQVSRTLQAMVRLRNDAVGYFDAALPKVCP